MRASFLGATAAFALGMAGGALLSCIVGNGHGIVGHTDTETQLNGAVYAQEGTPQNDVEAKTLTENRFGMFSWEEEVLSEAEMNRLADCIRETAVSEVYQEFTEESLVDGRAEAFTKGLCQQGVSVYALMGAAEWAYEKNAETLTEKIRCIAAFNEKQSENTVIHGVMVDVEPYALPEWGEGNETRRILMESYLSCMSVAYDCAQEHGLEFLVCIPKSYDVSYPDILEKLIAGPCDGIAVMNYDRTDEYMQMAKEAGYAREYRKRVICIYELQRVGTHDLEEINTYHNVGLGALWESARRLRQQVGYERLSFAYHYYLPLREMLSGND